MEAKPDVLCLQETKAADEDVPLDARALDGYECQFQPAKKKGYSGVGVYYKKRRKPKSIAPMGIEAFDDEGRVQQIEYDDYVILNCYWPNSQPERKRLQYKLEFGEALWHRCDEIVKGGKGVIVCGDGNIAHTEKDIARPKQNENNPGYYIEEREFMTRFLNAGYVDAFRALHPDAADAYSWWSYRANAREKNIGWRLDYHIVNEGLMPRVKKARIHQDVMGSDHCPVSLEIT